jgi:RNA polymerase sigma-70 factor (ECF subfamily)
MSGIDTAALPVRAAGNSAVARRAHAFMLPTVQDPASEDGQLICRYADGDVAAFERLYEKHRLPLWRFLQRHLREEAATADVFQETWARVIAHADRYRPTAPFGAWLYRIAHHCCVDHWRRSGRTRRREVAGEDVLAALPDAVAPGPAEYAMNAQAAQALHAAVAQLPDDQRAAFLMYAECGLSLAEIALATGVGVETAKSRLRYAAAKLRLAMTAAVQGDGT